MRTRLYKHIHPSTLGLGLEKPKKKELVANRDGVAEDDDKSVKKVKLLKPKEVKYLKFTL